MREDSEEENASDGDVEESDDEEDAEYISKSGRGSLKMKAKKGLQRGKMKGKAKKKGSSHW